VVLSGTGRELGAAARWSAQLAAARR